MSAFLPKEEVAFYLKKPLSFWRWGGVRQKHDMKILKFGGTSVGSVQSIHALLNILKGEVKNEKPVVVLSAMSGVTNLLISMAEGAANGQDFTAELAELEKRHFDVVKSLLTAQHQNPAYTRL